MLFKMKLLVIASNVAIPCPQAKGTANQRYNTHNRLKWIRTPEPPTKQNVTRRTGTNRPMDLSSSSMR